VGGFFEVSEEAIPPCAYHTPRESILLAGRGPKALVWLLMVVAAFAFAYGLTRALWPVSPSLRADPIPELQLAVEAEYDRAVVGKSYKVIVFIHNTSDTVAENVRFEIARDPLRSLYLKGVMPEPSDQSESARWRTFFYPALSPHERRRMAIELVPREAGTFHLAVRLLSGKDLYHGLTDLPITVSATERPYAGHAPDEGEQR
jgi:hypothetical protein